MRTAIIVLTFNPGSKWDNWVRALLATGVDIKDVYVIDSDSTDGAPEKSQSAGFHVVSIEQSSFNHGGTRKMAAKICSDYDIAIFLTQDAILCNANSLNNILAPFRDSNVAAVCGRQLPRKEAGAIESPARLYNYSEESFARSSNDASKFGLKTAFISNSFAAYRLSVLEEVGNFPEDVIFGEDMYVATRMLKAGYKIAYAAEACVYHSHDYSVWQEMKRYFDMGVFHAREPWIRQQLGGAEGEGVKFVISELKYLMKHAFWRIPEGMARTLFRYVGFRLGMAEQLLPMRIKRGLAMNHGFFRR